MLINHSKQKHWFRSHHSQIKTCLFKDSINHVTNLSSSKLAEEFGINSSYWPAFFPQSSGRGSKSTKADFRRRRGLKRTIRSTKADFRRRRVWMAPIQFVVTRFCQYHINSLKSQKKFIRKIWVEHKRLTHWNPLPIWNIESKNPFLP